jgi:hypothetical protein
MCVGKGGGGKVDSGLTFDCWHGRLAFGLSLVLELFNSYFDIGLTFRILITSDSD